MPKFLLEPEDGAEFRGRVTPGPDGSFEAFCLARLEHCSYIEEEEPLRSVFETDEAANHWIDTLCAERGFSGWGQI